MRPREKEWRTSDGDPPGRSGQPASDERRRRFRLPELRLRDPPPPPWRPDKDAADDEFHLLLRDADGEGAADVLIGVHDRRPDRIRSGRLSILGRWIRPPSPSTSLLPPATSPQSSAAISSGAGATATAIASTTRVAAAISISPTGSPSPHSVTVTPASPRRSTPRSTD